MDVFDATKFRALRRQKGLTMRGVTRACQALGLNPKVPHSAVSQYEAGTRQPREPHLLALAQVVGVADPNDLLTTRAA